MKKLVSHGTVQHNDFPIRKTERLISLDPPEF